MASIVAAWPAVGLGEALIPISRPVRVNPSEIYPLLGMHWYAEGLYIKDRKAGTQIQADTLYQVHAGDFVYNRLFAWKGSFGVADGAVDGCYVSNEFPCFAIDETRLLPGFLCWYFAQSSVWQSVEAQSSGSTPTSRLRLKEPELLAMQLPLPPLDEQRRIVARIEELASRIEEARGLRREAADEAERLWAGGARSLLAGLAVEYMPLRALVYVQGGGTPSKANPLFWQGAIPWVSPKDMKTAEIIDAGDHISEDALSQSVTRLIEPGAVLVVTRGMILAHAVPVAILRVPAAINQDMKALKPSPAITSEYLCAALQAYNAELIGLVDRSSHDTRKLETPKLLDFLLPVPNLDEQRYVVAHLGIIQRLVDGLRRLQSETEAEVQALLPSVLDQAFRGEL